MDGAPGVVEVQSSHFVPTELPNAIDHFLCRLCGYVVFQPKECPKCNCVYCHECNCNFIQKQGKWQCREC